MSETPSVEQQEKNDLGTVLITGGGGFVGTNFVQTLLDRGNKVKSLDLVACPLEHENLESIIGNICDAKAMEEALQGVDTVFHTAAIIELKGGKAVTPEYRERSYAVNVEGTKTVLRAAQKQGVKRFVYTASNSVVIGGEHIRGGDESLPYTDRFNDLYTETKVVAEKFVLAEDGKHGMHTCSIRPSGIWGPGDQTMFVKLFDQLIAGLVKMRVGDGSALLDNSYVFNLIHGQILAAEHLGEGGTANGQAYFINDGDAVNMMEFSRPIIEATGNAYPKVWVPAFLVKAVMNIWQFLHFSLKLPEPPIPPLAVDRIALCNYFSIEKARRDLGYEPPYTTEQAMEHCLPAYIELYKKMAAEAGKA